MHRGRKNLIRSNLFHQQADTDHIRNGVHGADLVEMDFRYRFSVCAALCIRDQGVDGFGIGLHFV